MNARYKWSDHHSLWFGCCCCCCCCCGCCYFFCIRGNTCGMSETRWMRRIESASVSWEKKSRGHYNILCSIYTYNIQFISVRSILTTHQNQNLNQKMKWNEMKDESLRNCIPSSFFFTANIIFTKIFRRYCHIMRFVCRLLLFFSSPPPSSFLVFTCT